MGDFPLLHESGLVQWPDDAAMRAQWPATLGRGALIVRPGRPLAALEVVDVVIDVVGSPAITVRAEVVRIEPERTLLRLLEGPVPLPPPAPVNPFASRSIPIPSSLTPLANEMPAPDLPPRPVARIAPGVSSAPVVVVPSAPLVVVPPASVVEAPAIVTPSSVVVVVDAPAVIDAPPTAEPVKPAMTLLEPEPPPAVEPQPALFTMAPPAPSRPVSAPSPVSAPLPSSSFSISPPTPTDVRPAVSSSLPSWPVGRDCGPYDDRSPSRRFVEPPDAPDVDDPFASTPHAAGLGQRATSSRVIPSGGLSGGAWPAALPSPLPAATPSTPPTLSASSTGHIDAGPLRAAVPPVLIGDTLRFGSTVALQAARRDLVGVGAVLAICDTPPPAGVVDVRLIAGSAFAQTKVKCTFAAAAAGTVVIQARRKDDWRIPLAELDANSSGPVFIAPPPTSVSLSLPYSGSLTNPLTPRGIMMLPVHRTVTEADLKQPSVPLFLRWLRTTKGVFRVELASEGQPIHTLIVVDGREIRSPVALATVGKALANHTYTYTMAELPRAPTLSTTGRTLHLIVEVLRSLLALHDLDEIAAAFPHSKDPRLVRAVGSVADALGYTGPLARLIKSNLQGDDTVRGIARAAVGARAVWDVLVPLELFAGLTLVAGEPRRSTPIEAVSGVGSGTGAPVIVEPFADKDHFAVLGLHWSCSPSAVIDAHVKVRRDFGPGGSRRPIDDAIAGRALKRIDEAFSVLGNTEKRQAYRKTTFNMVWPQQATLLVQQAKLAIYRKDLTEARDLLAAAQDISPSPEARVLLDTLNRTG